MECYEGATMIKTFRSLMVDGAQDTIVLHSNDGSTGYRVVKFQIIPTTPGAVDVEYVVKIYKVSQTPATMPGVTATIDFSDNTLLGAAFISDANSIAYTGYETIIFDSEIFNQDIYVTLSQVSGSGVACNYYIELEQVKLDLGANTVATLKDIRNELRIPPG